MVRPARLNPWLGDGGPRCPLSAVPRVCAGPDEGWDRLGQPGKEEVPIPGVTAKALLNVVELVQKVMEASRPRRRNRVAGGATRPGSDEH